VRSYGQLGALILAVDIALARKAIELRALVGKTLSCLLNPHSHPTIENTNLATPLS
jgi:hypothetical protein